MIIFPAVDIQNGKAVRLRKGDKTKVTVFADDPVDAALLWANQGAKWLHVIDLDGAFAGESANARIIGKIRQRVNLPVQVGGGIRSIDIARKYLDAGIDRLIIGTMALERPLEFARLCQAFPGGIGVSLDASNGILKSRGWLADSRKTVQDVLPQLEDAGASFIIYTDIERDGMQSGLNYIAIKNLLQQTALPVIAAGGVATLDDVRALAKFAGIGNLEGMISGRALYEKTLDLQTAQAWLDNALI